MIVSNVTMSLSSAIEEFQNIAIKNYGTDSATAQNYLGIADRLRRFAEESSLSSVDVLTAFYTKDFIYQKPIRLNVALSCPSIIPRKIVIMIPCIQRTAISKDIYDFKKSIQIFVLHFRQLEPS